MAAKTASGRRGGRRGSLSTLLDTAQTCVVQSQSSHELNGMTFVAIGQLAAARDSRKHRRGRRRATDYIVEVAGLDGRRGAECPALNLSRRVAEVERNEGSPP